MGSRTTRSATPFLIVPRLLNFIVAIYLIVIGLLGLFGGHLNLH